MSWNRKSVIVGLLCALFVAGGALAAAAATSCASTSGSQGCWNDATNIITARDTAVNGNEVYTDYCLSSNSSQTSCSSFTRLYNAGDTLDTVSAGVSVGSNTRIIFRSCQAVPVFPDVCSSWTNAAT